MALFKCPHCGNLISDNAIRCPKCGFEVPRHPFYEKSYAHEKMGREIDYPGVDSETKQKNNSVWLIAGAIIIVIGIVVLGILFFNKDNKNKEPKIVTVQEKPSDGEIIAEQVRQDSLMAVQREAERLEELRMDSIKAVKERIEKATIHWDDLIKYDSTDGYWVHDNKALKKKLKSKGFEQTDHNRLYITDSSWEDYWQEDWTYTFFKDEVNKRDKLYKVTFFDTDCSVRITVYDSKLLSLLSKELKSKKLSVMPDGGIDEWKEIYYEGNTIDINFCGD